MNDASALFARYEPSSKPIAERPADLTVREAAADDIESLATLTFERSGGDLSRISDKLAMEISEESGGSFLLVAETAGVVVGLGRVRFFSSSMLTEGRNAPEGWYLMGVIVSSGFRRIGVASELTERRLQWIAERADEAYYFANAMNRPTIDLSSSLARANSSNISPPGRL
ncbi:MAG: GNAT family N-acetyltransferase [Candidatus Xenobiia bacterium LiM19]